MKYFLDTEFIEGTQKKMLYETKPTIDLISIGIVCEDGREYYAISKDFNLKEAWNRYDCNVNILTGKEGERTYWIRENVLKPICIELEIQYLKDTNPALWVMNQNADWSKYYKDKFFTYKRMKQLLQMYGKTNKQIASEVKDFVYKLYMDEHPVLFSNDYYPKEAEFYGYYSDYDWVVFCWLFGRMIDLPKGFPMYCKDLKQTLDEKCPNGRYMPKNSTSGFPIKEHQKYPKQTNEHNALADARWNYELYKFLKTL